MLQFPEDIMSMDLANSNVVLCERNSVDPNSALCKPKTYDKFSTNLIVTTESNKYNLSISSNLGSKPSNNIITFKYKNTSEPELYVEPKTLCVNNQDRVLSSMIKGFNVENINKTSNNNYAGLTIDKALFLGDQIYITFRIENNHYAIYEILRVDVYLENLGGLTGLSIRSEKVVHADYRLSGNKINTGNSIHGVVKFKNTILREDQALSLRIVEKTDQRKDLYFKFDMGV